MGWAVKPEIGKRYVCRNSAPPGWSGETVEVIDVADTGQRTARVRETVTLRDASRTVIVSETVYETVVSWNDLVPDPGDARR